MPTYPVIPLAAKQGNPLKFEPLLVSNQFKEGQAKAQARKGAFPSVAMWEISKVILNRDVVDQFLEQRAGQPFQFNYDGAVRADISYRCEEWEFEWMVDGVWGFTAKFEQVRRLA